MDPIQLIIALITAAEKATALARTLSEAKKKADSENRDLTADEINSFASKARSSIADLDDLIAEAEIKERG